MLPQPKPEPIAKGKRRQQRQRTLSRRQCRLAVYQREHMRCQRCSRAVTLDCWPGAPQRAHVNELVPRSAGGSPVDVDNLELCCGSCHMPNGWHAPTPERMQRLLAIIAENKAKRERAHRLRVA